jgi:KamA family protein
MPTIRYLRDLDQIPQLTPPERARLRTVTDTYSFRTNEYYQSLIDWTDPADPIRRIIMPHPDELDDQGRLDPSDEQAYTVVPGLEHKYEFTALLLVNNVCGGYCRFCFRKRLFMNDNDEVTRDIDTGLDYIRRNPQLNNILLTGGDPLLLATRKLGEIVRRLREIEHVQIIRIGSKMPAFNPYRILDDPELPELFRQYSTPAKRIYLMAHFNHPRELTPVALEALDRLHQAGVVTVNQTPLLRGVNDDPAVLGDLFNKLSYCGVPPYYLFQCRPTAGNRMFAIPIEQGYEIFEKARMHCSGLAKRARFVMSHATGKIEMVGRTRDEVYFRYHRAADPEGKGHFMVFKSNPEAYWLDDYETASAEYSINDPERCFGPE